MANKTKFNLPQIAEEPELKLVRFDWAIKNLLRNKANFDILEGFLSELLGETIIIDSLLESEGNQETVDNKFNRVDLLVNTSSKEKIIIEVQTASEWDFYHRILFGTSKIITEYIKKGQPFSKVPKVILVSILFFNLGVGSDYVYKGVTEFTGIHTHDSLQLTDKSIDLYINQLQKNYVSPSDVFPTYYIIQLKKFTDKIKDKFDQWVYLLKHKSIKAGFDAQGIKSATEKLNILKLSPKKRREYERYWQDLSYEASQVEIYQVELAQARRFAKKEGHEEGLEKGREEGKQKSMAQVAIKMRQKGFSIQDIMDSTGLKQEELEQLLHG